MATADTPWTAEPGERYHARRYLGAWLSAGTNHSDWRGPRAPWWVSVDCTRAEAEALIRELGVGEARARGSLDELWSWDARGVGDDQADAQALAETMARRAVEAIGRGRAS